MKLEKIQPGATLWDVGRTKMGNTTMTTLAIWPVHIVSVDLEKRTVRARWNHNQERAYTERSWKKWRESRPMTVAGPSGRIRLATREEIAAAKAKQLGALATEDS